MDESTITKIWEMPTGDAVTAIVEDIRAQVRGGRSYVVAASALRSMLPDIPREHRSRVGHLISGAALVHEIPGDLDFMARMGYGLDRAAVSLLQDARDMLPTEGGIFAAYERALNAEVLSRQASASGDAT